MLEPNGSIILFMNKLIESEGIVSISINKTNTILKTGLLKIMIFIKKIKKSDLIDFIDFNDFNDVIYITQQLFQ